MIDTKMLVNDVLLRELSAETRKIGSRVLVKATAEQPEYAADIIDVIIMPHAGFYRTKFLAFYKQYNQNSVKALKELANTFPYTPDYELGIAYVLNLRLKEEEENTGEHIKLRSEFEPLDIQGNTIQNKSYISL